MPPDPLPVVFFGHNPSPGGGTRVIQLTPDEPSLTLSYNEPDDEGYRAGSTTWTLIQDDGPPYILQEWEAEGRDCDGGWGRKGECVCPVSELQVRVPYAWSHLENGKEIAPYLLPNWQEESRSYYDQYAEAAGY